MESRLFRYIWRHSWRDQAVILATVLVSLVTYYLSLELPKTIINDAIGGGAFRDGARAAFLRVEIGVPELLGGGTAVPFAGLALDQVPYLLALSGAFLALVVINNAFKFRINTLKGRVGERMLRRMRYELFDRAMRFPLPHYRRVKPAEVATMVKDEVEPVGGFVGEAFVTPTFLGGQALTAMIFIVAQNLWLGGIAFAVVAVQGGLIPRLRRPLLRLGRERQITARQLAGRVAEYAEAAVELRAGGATQFARADIADRLHRIFGIRFRIYQRKFFIKGLNNFLAQLTPFIFYALGGYFVVTGRLDLGALVAVIAAYKDLPGPIKELIDWDQQRLDAQIKFQQVVEQFEVPGMVDAARQAAAPDTGGRLAGAIAVSALRYAVEGGAGGIDGLSFEIGAGEKVAMAWPANAARTDLAHLLAGLATPTGGRVAVGGTDLATAAEALLGRRVGFVGAEPRLLTDTIRANLLLGLRHYPVAEADERPAERLRRLAEARRTGNTPLDAAAEWTDHAAAGAADDASLDRRIVALFDAFGTDDLYQIGLHGPADPDRHPALAERVLAARRDLRTRLAAGAEAGLVEPFDAGRFIVNASLGENLVFASAPPNLLPPDALAESGHVRAVVEACGLTGPLTALGAELAGTLGEVLGAVDPGSALYEQVNLASAAELDGLREIHERWARLGAAGLDEAARRRLVSLALRLVPAQHRIATVGDDLRAAIVAARHRFMAELPEAMRGALAFYEAERYLPRVTIIENILFGKVVRTAGGAKERLAALVGEALGVAGGRVEVATAALDHDVGVGGSRLTAGQRQLVAIARALLKRPDILVLDGGLSPFEAETRARLQAAVLAEAGSATVAWLLGPEEIAEDRFDRVLGMASGDQHSSARTATVAA